MLYEFYTSLTTSCPAYVRHMDYLYEVIAMRGRALRNREAWQPHLDNTRAFVLAAAEKCEKRTIVVIFGAGLLLDVPLSELSTMFQEVHLLDIVFLPEVRRQARQYGNVRLIQHDTTNMAEALYTNVHQGIRDLPEPSPSLPESSTQAGLVVSHYTFLQSLASPVCLVADYEYVKRDKEGIIVNRGSTIAGLALPEPDASWTWHIAPLGESSPYVSKELNVGAWHLR